MQRVRGATAVTLGRAGLVDLRQSGSAKAMLPRTHGPVPEVVFLNTAGGVTGGDRLSYALTLGDGARAVAATQTAERAYRSGGGTGVIETRIHVGAGARLDWLPQETILFEGSDTRRDTMVALGDGATVLLCDAVVLGRAAMGETVRAARLDDRRAVHRDGRPVHEEHLTLDADALSDPWCLGDARALATVALVGPGAEDAAAPLGRDGFDVSAWDGRLVLRLIDRDPARLRRALVRAIVALRGGPATGAMPRVWQVESAP